MYNLGCGLTPCGRMHGLSGVGATSLRFDTDAWLDRAEYELRDESRPLLYFWIAYDLADWLEEWLMNVSLGAPWLPGPNGGDVNPNYVNAIIDVDTALAEIDAQLKKAVDQGLDFGPSLAVNPGNRLRQSLQTLYDRVAHVSTILAAILVAVENTRAGALATVYRRAKEAGADISNTRDFLASRLEALVGHAGDVVQYEIVDPVQEAAQQFGDDVQKAVQNLAWSDILKVLVPVGVIGGLALYALKKA